MPTSTQLPLTLPHVTQYGRDDFIVGPSNEAALRVLDGWPDGGAPLALLSGPSGSGKTHLVHIWAARTGAAMLDPEQLGAGPSPRALSARALAVDGLRPGAFAEAGLFHLINGVRDGGGALLLSAAEPAEALRVTLPDLRSRLRAAMPVRIGAPDDDLLRKALVKLFSDRQLLVEKPVIDYLLYRMERSLAAAGRLVAALDRAALAAGRSITRPMAAEVLSEVNSEAFADRQ
jgi:chromosomal replication initiation ATPase DnaA